VFGDDSKSSMHYAARWLPHRKVHDTICTPQLGGSYTPLGSRKQGKLVTPERVTPVLGGYINHKLSILILDQLVVLLPHARCFYR
jgi:hypothetical protein